MAAKLSTACWVARAAYNDTLQDGTVERIGYSIEDEVVTRRIGDNLATAR
jgi:hypothetical protein